jgi:hypothetical protein
VTDVGDSPLTLITGNTLMLPDFVFDGASDLTVTTENTGADLFLGGSLDLGSNTLTATLGGGVNVNGLTAGAANINLPTGEDISFLGTNSVAGTFAVDAGSADIVFLSTAINADGFSRIFTQPGHVETNLGTVSLTTDGGRVFLLPQDFNTPPVSVTALDVTATGMGDVDVQGIDLGSATIDADTGSVFFSTATSEFGTLTVTGSSSITDTSGNLTVTGVADLTSTGEITLDDGANDFGTISAQTAASEDIILQDSDDIQLGTINANNLRVTSGTGGITDTDGQSITIESSATFTAATGQDVVINNLTHSLSSVVATGRDVTLNSGDGFSLDGVTVSGNLSARVTTGDLSDGSNANTITGTSTLQADIGSILFDNVGLDETDFGGAVDATAGSTITLVDPNEITLGSVSGASLDVSATDVEITTSVDVMAGTASFTDSGVNGIGIGLAVADPASDTFELTDTDIGNITAGTIAVISNDGNVTFETVASPGADFEITAGLGQFSYVGASTGLGNLTVVSADSFRGSMAGDSLDLGANTLVVTVDDDIELRDITAGAVDLNLGDDVTIAGVVDIDGALEIDAGPGSASIFFGAPAAVDMDGNVQVVEDAGAMLTLGALTLRTDDGDISSTTSDFSAIDTVSLLATGSGSLTISDLTANTLVLNSGTGDVIFEGDASEIGDLSIVGNNVTQDIAPTSLGITVTGDTSILATNNITLTDSANEFGPIHLTGVDADIVDTGAMELGAISLTGNLTATAGGDITDDATGIIEVNGTSSLTSTGDIVLEEAHNFDADSDGSEVNADGLDITLVDINGITLGDLTAAGNLTVAAQSGGIEDTLGEDIQVSGTTSLSATGDISLGQLIHDFDNDGSGDNLFAAGDAVTLGDGSAIILGAVTAGSLSVAAGGSIEDTATEAISVSGATTLDAIAGGTLFDITLDGDGHQITDLSFVGQNVDIRSDAVGELTAANSFASGSVTITALNGLSLDTISAETPGAALIGISENAGVSATDVRADTIVLGGTGSTAASVADSGDDVSIDGFVANTALRMASAAGSATVRNGALPGTLDISAPTQIYRGVTFTSGGAVPTGVTNLVLDRVVFVEGTSISAGDIELGFIQADAELDLTATTGSVSKLADADIEFAEAGGGDVIIQGVDTARADDDDIFALTDFGATLLTIAGDANLSATSGSVVLVRGENPVGGALFDVDFQGTVGAEGIDIALEDVNSLTLAAVTATNDLVVRFDTGNSGTETLTQTAPVEVSNAAAFISGSGAPAALLSNIVLEDAGNDFGTVQVIGDQVELRDSDGFTLAASLVQDGLTIGGPGDAQSGPVSISDLVVSGGLNVSVTGDVYEYSKILTPLLMGAILAKTIVMPIDSLLFAGIAIVVSKAGVSTICKGHE